MKRDIDEVIKKYKDLIYRTAYLNLKLKSYIDDVFQDVIIKYFTYKKDFENEEHEKNWILRTTINHCKNLSKTAWFRYTVSMGGDCLELETEEEYKILEELDKLSPKYKAVVQLFYYEDLSIEQISKILNISEETVRTRLCRARHELKIEIERRDKLDDRV